MKVTLEDNIDTVRFEDLQVGDLFEEDKCIAIKIEEQAGRNALVIYQLINHDNNIPAGQRSWWPADSKVHRIKEAIFKL